MAWTVLCLSDPDKIGIAGVATATWDSGQSDQFIYSRRATFTDSNDMSAFVTEAQAALTAQVAANTSDASISTELQTLLSQSSQSQT